MTEAMCEQRAYTIDELFADFVRKMHRPKNADHKPPIKDITIEQIYKIDPRIKEIIDEAATIKNPYWTDYSAYKERLTPLVGYESEKGEIASEAAYNLVINALVNTLKL